MKMKTPDGKEFEGTVDEIMSVLNVRYRMPTTSDDEQNNTPIKKIGQSNEERLVKQREYNRAYRAKHNVKKKIQTNYEEKIGVPLCRYAIQISKQTGITTPKQLADEMKIYLEKQGVPTNGYKARRRLVQACYIGMKLMKKETEQTPTPPSNQETSQAPTPASNQEIEVIS
jgi:hypothetical protein